MTRLRRVIAADRADCSTWPSVAWPALPVAQQQIFRAREDAVLRYCRREPLRTIEAATGITYSSIRRLYERCLQMHADGRLQGWRALIPFEQFNPIDAQQRLCGLAVAERPVRLPSCWNAIQSSKR